MYRVEQLSVKEAAVFEGVNPKTLLKRLLRKDIFLANDPEDLRRKLVPASARSTSAGKAFLKAKVCSALRGIGGQPQPMPCGEEAPAQAITAAKPSQALQPALAFAVPTQREQMLLNAVPPAIPHRYQPFIDCWAAIVGDNLNGTWKRYVGSEYGGFHIRTRCDFIRAQAKVHGIGVSTIHSKLTTLRQINQNPRRAARAQAGGLLACHSSQ